MNRFLGSLLAILLLISCNNDNANMKIAEVDAILKSYVDNNKAPSVQYLIFDKDSVIHRFNYGLASVEGNVQTQKNTTYAAFSVTKTFTALAILQLAENGKLDIDDKVQVYLDDFPYSSDITIRQLLAHTSGISNPLPLKWVHLPEERQSFDRNDYFKSVFIENSKTKSEPNEKFKYTNLGYFILGQLIEYISGLSYEEYVHEYILRPLQLSKSDLDFEIADPKLHATGYQKKFSFLNLTLGFLMDKSKFVNKKEGKWISFRDMYVHGPSYGGLIGTSSGFMQYIQELLKPDGILLSREFIKVLLTENLTNSKDTTGMCLSWFKGSLNNQIYYAHSGGGPGYYCEIRLYPELGVGSVVMFNRTGMKREHFLSKLDKYYLNGVDAI